LFFDESTWDFQDSLSPIINFEVENTTKNLKSNFAPNNSTCKKIKNGNTINTKQHKVSHFSIPSGN
jgi:hypothetical protein